MITHSPLRRAAALFTALAVAGGALLLPAAAGAAEGPAPAPKEFRVIAGVHTDAVSTFLDDGQLALASRADVPEGNGTRFAANDIWFHLENDAQQPVPAGYDFVAPAGSTVWMAPESNPGAGRLWPGFNTESVAPGAIEGDQTTFTLTSFDGPGQLEVFTGGGFGDPVRLWSSQDAGIRAFDIGRTHQHANWAFTAAGTYRLGVEGAVTVDGARQTAQATYTFVVGDLPDAVPTTTSLDASAATLVAGDPLTLTAQVTPTDTEGYVEFRNGSAVLGHEAVADGTAALTTTAPPVGSHVLTAVFVPAVANLAQTSISEPVTVNVTDGSGVEFGIAGVAGSYQVGDVLDARVVGHTLEEGQTYRWAWRPVGVESSYVLTGTGGQEAAGFLTLPLDMSHNGYEISVTVREGNSNVTRSAWIPLVVESDVAPITGSFPSGDLFLGDEVLFTLDRLPAEGDSVRLAYRYISGPWTSAEPITTQIDADTLRLRPESAFNDPAWVVQTVRDGRVISQSDPMTKSVKQREVMMQGLQSVYRTGQTLRVTAEVHPVLEGATYAWELFKWNSDTMTMDTVALKEGSDPSDLTVELPIEAHHDGWTLGFEARLPDDSPLVGGAVAWFYQTLTVSDSDPDTQLLFFETLSNHYHQGGDINLNLVADPALADGDTIAWEWKWPGAEQWAALPDASGLSHALVAEQALHGVEIRATLRFDGGADDLTADPVTILVDDHGAPPRQEVTITGDDVQDDAATLTEGEPASLTAEVSNGTVLDSFQWFLKTPGAAEAEPVQGATSAAYEFEPTSTHDGAELSVAVVKPDGSLAYGPSAPVTLTVEEAGEEPVTTTVTISGLQASYEIGDTMTLTASQDPDTGEDHWHWFIKPAGAEEYTVIPDELTSSLSRQVAAQDDGASIIVRLYDHDHAVIAESAPVTLTVEEAGEEPVPAKPTHTPAERTPADLDNAPEGGIGLSSSTVAPGDILTVDLAGERANSWVAAWLFSTPTLLGDDWTQADGAGAITVQIPAGTSPGAHQVAVFAADDSLIGWANITVAQPTDPGADNPGTDDPTPDNPTPDNPTPDNPTPDNPTPDDPTPDDPTPDNPPANDPAAGLPDTGGTPPFAVLAFAVLLTITGATLVAIRRMRHPTTA